MWLLFYSLKAIATLLNYTCKSFIKWTPALDNNPGLTVIALPALDLHQCTACTQATCGRGKMAKEFSKRNRRIGAYYEPATHKLTRHFLWQNMQFS